MSIANNLIDEGLVSRIHAKLDLVLENIAHAAEAVHRNPQEVRLITVSKSQPIEVVEAAILAGAQNLGENYAELAAPKIEALGNYSQINWHMIGHVQARKARLVCENFQYVHSLDSLKLAEKYNAICQEMGRILPVLLELNLAAEETKSGWHVEGGDITHLFVEFEQIFQLPHLKVRGLMTMPPLDADPEKGRVYFHQLAKLRDQLQGMYAHIEWADLSMGTSADYEIAVQEGATYVRVGQAILGPRPKKTTIPLE
jgi:PLP dependent protein